MHKNFYLTYFNGHTEQGWFFLFFKLEWCSIFFHAIIKSIRDIYVSRIFIDFLLKDIYGSLVKNHTRTMKKKNYYLWMEIEFSYGRISVLKFYPIVILFWVEENERGKKKRKKGSKRKHAFKWWNYEIFKISCNSSVNVTANLFRMNAILELNMW